MSRPTFDDIQPALATFREAYAENIRPLVEGAERTHIATALLVCVGHEEVSLLRTGRRHQGATSFTSTLPLELQPLGPSIYGAVRHGLAHTFGTLIIDAEGTTIAVWFAQTAKPAPHKIDKREIDEVGTNARIVLNVRSLLAGLGRAFDALESDLRASRELRRAFCRNVALVQPRQATGAEAAAWRRVLSRPTPIRFT